MVLLMIVVAYLVIMTIGCWNMKKQQEKHDLLLVQLHSYKKNLHYDMRNVLEQLKELKTKMRNE